MKFFKHKFILPITVFFMLAISNLPLANNEAEVFSEQQSVIPCGTPVGIAVYTKGVLITDIASVTDINGNEMNISRDAGLRKGDIILTANNREVNTIDELSRIIAYESPLNMNVSRNGQEFSVSIIPADTVDGKKAGLWVRDSTAGIGTLTWYNPDTKEFAALGHGISDADTGSVINVRSGDMFSCKITGIVKGQKGTPGELNGVFQNNLLGSISRNTVSGIRGTVAENSPIPTGESVKIADKRQICAGGAYILCDVDGKGAKSYEISILKINHDNTDGKNFIIKVTDEKLIKKTGGIVQGMSGSPIIQNGKLIGAVTHVFVNDPTRGYGIFIENMLAEAEKIK